MSRRITFTRVVVAPADRAMPAPIADHAPAAAPGSYTPIDTWLSKPSTRILRALRFFDCASAHELFIAIDVPMSGRRRAADGDTTEQNTYSKALSRLVMRGWVERTTRGYRLIDAGRAELARRLTTDTRDLYEPARPGTEQWLCE